MLNLEAINRWFWEYKIFDRLFLFAHDFEEFWETEHIGLAFLGTYSWTVIFQIILDEHHRKFTHDSNLQAFCVETFLV